MLFEFILETLMNKQRKFLVTFKSGDPDWTLLGVPDAELFLLSNGSFGMCDS